MRERGSHLERRSTRNVASTTIDRANVSPHQTSQVFADTKFESTKTSDGLETAHLFEIPAIDAYSHLSKASCIDDDINFSTCTVDSGSVSIARVPVIIVEHPAMYAMPMSAAIGVWEREPSCHMP
ncbi:hypothetical protein RSAG8_03463, partial [Rhizoctonia solani AG-8 WAC10335]